MKNAKGFTLLEVTIAGAILLMGMLLIANVTRTVMDTTAPDSPQAVQNGPVIEQYLRSEIALLKACRDGSSPTVGALPYGNGTLVVEVGVPTDVVGPVPGNHLVEYDVQVKLVQPGPTTTLVAHTRFWKLWRDDLAKAGI